MTASRASGDCHDLSERLAQVGIGEYLRRRDDDGVEPQAVCQ